jgi:hypothetical protein
VTAVHLAQVAIGGPVDLITAAAIADRLGVTIDADS